MPAIDSATQTQPAIGIGAVLHSRLRPAPNRFAYPAYFLRLPLRMLESQPWPFRRLARNGRALFAINDADHGDGRPLLAWIENLHSHYFLEITTTIQGAALPIVKRVDLQGLDIQ